MKRTKFPKINIQIKLVKILLTIFAIIFMLSCKDEDEIILEKTILQGTWVEVEPEDLEQYAGENHTFIFREDSFFLKLVSWTDVVYYDEEGNWIVGPQYGYRKGEYSFDANTITFNGKLGLDSDFAEPNDTSTLKTFQLTYDYQLKSLNTIILNPESEYESITLVKE